MKVKICGITHIEDAKAAVDFGADALGFIFAKGSSRSISPAETQKIIEALPPFVTTVGVVTEGTGQEIQDIMSRCDLDMIQFHGPFQQEVMKPFCTRAIQVISVQTADDLLAVRPLSVRAYLVDLPKTCPCPFDWKIVLPVKAWGNLILAGRLTLENLQEAIETVHPYAVDVCSGVEKEKGKKDYAKLKRFIEVAKEYACTAE